MDVNARATYEKKADYLRRTESRKASAAWKHDSLENEAKVSAFAIFSKERHEVLKQDSSELTVTDRARVIANEWKVMSKLDKIPFINAAKRETRRMRSSIADDDSENGEDNA
jgi:hypothetical protein